MLWTLPDLETWINPSWLLPAVVTLVLLLGEHLFASLLSASPWSLRLSLALGVHWLWPPLLLGWVIRRYPSAVDRLHLVPPESPLHLLSAVGSVFALLVVMVIMWWWIAPALQGPSLPFGPDPLPAPWRPFVLVGEALAHQIAFALLRLPALSEPAIWGICLLAGFLLGAGMWLTTWVRPHVLPRFFPFTLLGLIVGTGLVLSGYSWWAAFAWEWLFLLLVAR